MQSAVRFKLIYVVSLTILGLLVGLAMVRPAATSSEYSAVARESVVKTGSGYVVQLNIINHEGRVTVYTVKESYGDYHYENTVQIDKGATYSYKHVVGASLLNGGALKLAVHKEGQTAPFEELVYYLK